MQRIHRAEHIRMFHPETYRSISAHEISGDPARVPVRQRPKVRIDVRHQLLDHEVLPVTGRGRVDVPGTPEWRGHIHRYEDELVDHTNRDRSIEELLSVALVEERPRACPRARKKEDNRIALPRAALCRRIVARRKIDSHLPHRVGTDFVMRNILRPQLPIYNLALRRVGKRGDYAER